MVTIDKNPKSNIMPVIVLLVVFVLAYMLKPATILLPTGITLPLISLQNTPSSSDTIHVSPRKPVTATAIANLSIEYHVTSQSKASEELIIKKALSLAHEAGANGIAINLFGHTLMGQTPQGLAIYKLEATAYKN